MFHLACFFGSVYTRQCPDQSQAWPIPALHSCWTHCRRRSNLVVDTRFRSISMMQNMEQHGSNLLLALPGLSRHEIAPNCEVLIGKSLRRVVSLQVGGSVALPPDLAYNGPAVVKNDSCQDHPQPRTQVPVSQVAANSKPTCSSRNLIKHWLGFGIAAAVTLRANWRASAVPQEDRPKPTLSLSGIPAHND